MTAMGLQSGISWMPFGGAKLRSDRVHGFEWPKTRASRMSPRCCLAILNSGVLLLSFQKGLWVRKACCQLWVSREFLLFSWIFWPSGIVFFFPEAFLDTILSERLWNMGGFWARVCRVAVWEKQRSTSIWTVFLSNSNKLGTLEAFLIHNSSQLPRTFGIRIFFRVVSCDGWFVAEPLAGGKVGKKNAVEDDKRDPPDYSESIYAVPWNKGEHDNKTQQVHHIGSERAFVLRSWLNELRMGFFTIVLVASFGLHASQAPYTKACWTRVENKRPDIPKAFRMA